VALAILQHHERLDGSGYPRREKEKQLGIAGQIIAVADLATQLLLHKAMPTKGWISPCASFRANSTDRRCPCSTALSAS
jgi:hypothetical protein